MGKDTATPVAIVTGVAPGGLGIGLAAAFADAGHRLGILDLDGDGVEAAAADLRARGAQVVAVAGDVADPAVAEEVVATTVAAHGGIDALINNAQATRLAPLVELTVADAEANWRSGYLGAFNMMKAALGHLERRRGAVVNMVSGAMILPQPHGGVYGPAKAAIATLTRVAALEWASRGVRVNAVSPSARTAAFDAWAAASPVEHAARLADIPLGRVGDPERDIGRVVVWLAGEEASYITGTIVVADGGARWLG